MSHGGHGGHMETSTMSSNATKPTMEMGHDDMMEHGMMVCWFKFPFAFVSYRT